MSRRPPRNWRFRAFCTRHGWAREASRGSAPARPARTIGGAFVRPAWLECPPFTPSDRPSADGRRGNHLRIPRIRRGESAHPGAVAPPRREPVSSPRRHRSRNRTGEDRDLFVSARANRYVASLLAAGAGALALPALAAAGSAGARIRVAVEPRRGRPRAPIPRWSRATPRSAPPATASPSRPTPPPSCAPASRSPARCRRGNAGMRSRSTSSRPRPGRLDRNRGRRKRSRTARSRRRSARPAPDPSRSARRSRAVRPPAPRPRPHRSRSPFTGRSIATFYGPGFWGHKTACGVTLRRRTIGVANRTLPCGTEVQVYYNGNVITVPVIDRGPYAHHANWDLTMATARALGMGGTGVVGAAALPSTTTSPGTDDDPAEHDDHHPARRTALPGCPPRSSQTAPPEQPPSAGQVRSAGSRRTAAHRRSRSRSPRPRTASARRPRSALTRCARPRPAPRARR